MREFLLVIIMIRFPRNWTRSEDNRRKREERQEKKKRREECKEEEEREKQEGKTSLPGFLHKLEEERQPGVEKSRRHPEGLRRFTVLNRTRKENVLLSGYSCEERPSGQGVARSSCAGKALEGPDFKDQHRAIRWYVFETQGELLSW